MGGGYVKDIVLQAEEVALVVAALQRRCTQDARLAGGGRRREFGRTPRRQANLERAARSVWGAAGPREVVIGRALRTRVHHFPGDEFFRNQTGSRD